MRKLFATVGRVVVMTGAVAGLFGCGGGSKSVPPVMQPVAPPPPLAITTTSMPDGFYGEFYTATLQASNGVGALTWTVDGLPFGLSLNRSTGEISGIITDPVPATHIVEISLHDAASHQATKTVNFAFTARTRKILTTSLPDALLNRKYRAGIQVAPPDALLHLSSSSDPLPPGMGLAFGSNIFPTSFPMLNGKPTSSGTFTFTLELLDFTSRAVIDQRTFTLKVKGVGGGGNDSIALAPLLSNGTYFASISPYADPVALLPANPDNDYYKFTANPGAVVSVEIFAERIGTPLNAVVELLDSSGTRLNSCDSPGQSGFNSPCLDDDNQESETHDSRLTFKAPSGGTTTFFLHVLDWRGDARPDLEYQFQIFGVN